MSLGHYRLGDMIRFPNQRPLPGGAEWHLEKFPNSIVCKYLQLPQITDGLNTEGLASIIREFSQDIKPEDDELVIHLRIGDVMDHGHDEHLGKSKPLSFYLGLDLKKLNISKITLLIGSIDHNKKKENKNDRSHQYINSIKNFFEESGYRVYLRRGFSADEDFVFACRAKTCIPSNSGFSIVVEEVRKYLGYESYS